MPQIKRFREKMLVHLHLILLVIMIVNIFTLTNTLFLFNASATYIEGPITEDVVWTLTDSPFVVSKDVIVYPDATLTIEPGVEVKFGGNFSLIVNGQLIADGTQDRIIIFTSNKEKLEAGAGDWNSIGFAGIDLSTLTYCVVRYATSGITIENGNVKIENCEISNNLQDGITIENSIVEVRNNEIENNFRSGIYITGNNQVTIQNNTVRSNEDGILLTGDSTAGVDIVENTITSNFHSGIELNADDYSDTSILNNVLSANHNGFCVSGQANTYITGNSISHNIIGIFYSGMQNYSGVQFHEAHWNDIYGNELGMDVLSSEYNNIIVNAEYNYWGDDSGPYHASLNPAGNGNPVGGDGENLDFVFFLTAPIGYINEPPTANLLTDKKMVSPNQKVTFIATTSSDDRRVDQYLYDFGDGKNSGWTTLSIFVHEYPSTGTYNATLKVMDDFAVTSNNTATVMITCQTLPLLDVSLIPSCLEVGSERQIPITIHATNGTSPAENVDIVLFPIVGGSFTPSSGLTNSTGHFTSMYSAPKVTQITNVRITATASKAYYADGSDYEYLRVLPPLSVQVTANPERIKSEAIANVSVHVTYSGTPVSDATVVVASEDGSFDQAIGTTNENGDATFIFAAPHTGSPLNVTITATATKSGYIDGQGQTEITVEQALLVQVAVNPPSLNSEMTANVTVHVTYESNSISDAIVTLTSDNGGIFYPKNGITDVNGECEFTFTSPRVMMPTNITITVMATKTNYSNGRNQTTISVTPGELIAHVTANPARVESEAISTVTVHVTCNEQSVADAVVTVSSEAGGTFSYTIGTTNPNGKCTFVFTTPHTTTPLDITIITNVTKSGYIDGQGQTEITVNPAPTGLPLTLILVAFAAVTVVAIVLILIKLRIIAISLKEV